MRIFAAVAVLAVLCGVARAEESSWKSWYETTLSGLKSKVASKFESRNVRVTAVAAVRGAEMGETSPKDPYWKGGISEKGAKKLAAEKKEFADAIQLVLDGKMKEGTKALKDFEESHPDSVLIPDVKEALSKLPPSEASAVEAGSGNTEAAAQEKEQVKPAEKTEIKKDTEKKAEPAKAETEKSDK